MIVGPMLIFGSLTVAGALAVVGRATFAPRSGIWGPVLHRGVDESQPCVALTFDDGPHPCATPRILDILRGLDVPATFFVVGRNAEANPEVTHRAHAEGHLVANHSFDHDYTGAFRLDRYWRDQIARTDDVVEAIVGVRPGLFRPPMGFKTPHIMNAAKAAGHQVVTWSRRGRDGLRTTDAAIFARLSDARPGDVVLLHDGQMPGVSRDVESTIAALPRLIDAWRARGLRIVRLDQLLDVAPHQPCR